MKRWMWLGFYSIYLNTRDGKFLSYCNVHICVIFIIVWLEANSGCQRQTLNVDFYMNTHITDSCWDARVISTSHPILQSPFCKAKCQRRTSNLGRLWFVVYALHRSVLSSSISFSVFAIPNAGLQLSSLLPVSCLIRTCKGFFHLDCYTAALWGELSSNCAVPKRMKKWLCLVYVKYNLMPRLIHILNHECLTLFFDVKLITRVERKAWHPLSPLAVMQCRTLPNTASALYYQI